jgi:hypothetical protein
MMIKQLQLAYSAEEDRMLIRINSNEGQEIRCWLTRRMISRLLPTLHQVMKQMIHTDRPLPEPARNALLDMSRQASLQKADFQTPFQENAVALPLGPAPLLVSKVEMHPISQANSSDLLIKLSSSRGAGFEIRMNEQLQFALYDLIMKALPQTEWHIELPQIEIPEIPEEQIKRVLN